MSLAKSDLTGPPRIEPIPEGINRPFWSVMIPTYNCAHYLRQTLRSVLEQAPSEFEMQIEVVDDCSTKDDPLSVISEIGQNRVGFFRQSKNVGVTGNFNTCVRRARGRWIHILHGDDFVQPRFYKTIQEVSQQLEIVFISTLAFIVDAQGDLEAMSQRLKSLESPSRNAQPFFYDNPFRTPAIVIKRSFYEAEGGYRENLIHTADWEMYVRAILLGGGLTINQPLASYRVFTGNDTSRLIRTGENLRDYLRLAEVFATYLPGYNPVHFRKNIAEFARNQADSLRARGDLEAAKANELIWREVAAFRRQVSHKLRSVRSWLMEWINWRVSPVR